MIFKINKIKTLRKYEKLCARPGSAMILTMFILAGMLVVAMGGSYVVLLGIKAGGIQAQSTKAYFAAEAGIENILWQIRSGNLIQSATDISEATPCLSGDVGSDASYAVYFTKFPPRTYLSVGDARNTKRGVEVSW